MKPVWRRVSNPPNPYHAFVRELLVPAPEARIEYFEEEARSILVRNESPDVPFEYSVNPYRGCTHACAYCYARPSHEYLDFGAGTDFETKIIVKVNAPSLLRKALRKKSWEKKLIAFSGDTDCYQHAEAHYQLTRQCLEVCLEYRNPVAVITKSALVERDRELFKQLKRRAFVSLCVSLPFIDEREARKIEPLASSPQRRLETIARFAEAGVPVGILVAPLIPGLNDWQIPRILQEAASAGAQFAELVLLRLSGSLKDVFFERIEEAFPEQVEKIKKKLKEVRGGFLTDSRFYFRHRGEGVYWEQIESLFRLYQKKYRLDRFPEIPVFKAEQLSLI